MPHPAKSLKEKQCLEGQGQWKGVAGCPTPEGGVGAAGLGVLASHPVSSSESVESGAVVGSHRTPATPAAATSWGRGVGCPCSHLFPMLLLAPVQPSWGGRCMYLDKRVSPGMSLAQLQ